MKEGQTVDIPLRGIERNATIGTEPNGVMDDIVNFRHEGGSLRPVPQMKIVKGFESIDVSKYENIFIHTGSGYKNYLAIRSTGDNNYALFHIAKLSDNGEVERIAETNIISCDKEIEFNQVGNLVVICGKSSFAYLLFELSEGAYREANADFNGLQDDTLLKPDLDIKFRVTPCVTNNNDLDVLVYCGGSGVKNSIGLPVFENGYPLDIYSTMMLKALRCEKELGRLKGFFKLIYAYELFDGNHILHSQPILMCQANDYYTRLSGTMNAIDPSNNQSVTIDFKDYYLKNEIVYDCEGLNRSIVNIYDKGRFDDIYWSTNDACSEKNFCFTPKRYSKASRVQVFAGDDNGYKHVQNGDCLGNLYSSDYFVNQKHSTINIVSVANKLQYKIDKNISKEYRDIIKGVSVFISKEVYGYDTGNIVGKERTSWNYATYNEPAKYYSYQFKHRTNGEIIKEIERHDLYYKVCSIGFDKLSKGDWIDIDLKTDGVLANLEANERLKIDNGSRDSQTPKTTFTYNGKLHIANYGERMFRGFPLGYFYQQSGEGQFAPITNDIWTNRVGNNIRAEWESNSRPMICIETEIEGELGTNRVVRYERVPYKRQGVLKDGVLRLSSDITVPRRVWGQIGGLGGDIIGRMNINLGKTISSLNPIISYPDSRAKKMKITVQDVRIEGGNTRIYNKVLEFDLKESQYVNCAYYISPDLKPIDIYPTTLSVEPYMLPQEITKQQQQTSLIKVSEVGNPMYFPPANTYRIGSGSIVSMASSSVSVGSGQVGAAPLIVFCTDGIWALMVDGSGQLTYTNARPISRDVAIDPNSVKSIDGGIVFATDRGIMLLQGSQVIEIGEKAEGRVVSNFLQHGSDSLAYANQLFFSEKSVILLNEVSDITDFKKYIQNVRIGYNYNRKELIVANPDKVYHYALSHKGEWHKRSGGIRYFIEDYPDTYINIDHKILKLNSDSDNPVNTGFVTRAIKFGRQAFNRVTRAVLRGWYEVANYNYANEIDCNEIDMSEKADLVIELTDPVVREVRLSAHQNNNLLSISNLSQQPERVSKRIDITAEACLKYSIGDKSIVVNGAILFPANKYLQLYNPSDTRNNYIVSLIVKLNYMKPTRMAFGLTLNVPCSISVVIDNSNCLVPFSEKWQRTSDGSLWLSPDGSIYNNSGEMINDWYWRDKANGKRKIIGSNGSVWLTATEEYVALPLKDYAVGTYGKEYSEMTVTGKGIDLSILDITLKPNTYYTFHISPQHDIAGANRSGSGEKPITNLVLDNVSIRDIANTMSETSGVLAIGKQSVLGELSRRLLIAGNTYSVMSRENISVPYTEFLSNIHNGVYENKYVEADYQFNLIHGRAYRLTDLEGNVHEFYYSGSGVIGYSKLMSNIHYGIYERYDVNKTSPDKVYLSKGENLKVYYNNSLVSDFVYTGDTGHIKGSELLSAARDTKAKPIQYIDNNYMLYLINDTKIEISYREQVYKCRFRRAGISAGEPVEVSALSLINEIKTGLHVGLSDFDPATPIFLQNGATRLVDRSFNGEEPQEYEFIYYGDSPIVYSKLIWNVKNGVYTELNSVDKYAGIYVYGSYDGKRWALLGRNERTGTFRDLGCAVERMDCKYFKVMFFGNLTSDSSIDCLELSGKETIYKDKIR